MTSPFDFFDNIICVYLPHRQDRLSAASKQFRQVGILDRIRWIEGVVPPDGFEVSTTTRGPGQFGCHLGHLKAIASAVGWGGSALILEDDVHFDPNINVTLTQAIQQLPSDWAGLFLGGEPCDHMEYVDNQLAKVVGVFQLAHAYAVSATALPALLQYKLDHLVVEMPFGANDRTTARFLVNSERGYAVSPPVAFQNQALRTDMSKQDINQTERVNACWEAFAPPSHDRVNASTKSRLLIEGRRPLRLWNQTR